MRLDAQQLNIIKHAVRLLIGEGAQIIVFGSRLDNEARGGDLDLLLETVEPVPLLRRAQLKQLLEQQLMLPVDILIHCTKEMPTPFQRIALARGVRL